MSIFSHRSYFWLFIILLLVTAESQCKAGFIFAFNTSGTDQDFYAAAGANLDIPLYLVQTGTEDRLSTVGLFSAGASVTFSYGSGPLASASAASATLAAHWTDTSSNFTSVSANRVVMEGVVIDPFHPVFGPSNAILLGTIQFQAGDFGNVTNLQISLDDVTPLANNFVNLDEVTPITFRGGSITAVPEPTSMCLVGFTIATGICVRFRRTRSIKKQLRKHQFI